MNRRTLLPTRPARPLLWLALLSLGACTGDTGGEDIVDFELALKPLTPLNQSDLFTSVVRVALVVEPAIGDSYEFLLDDIAAGETDQVTGLPALDGAIIALEARSGTDEVKGFGRAGPLTISEGEHEVSILVSEVESFGWLGGLDEGLAGGALVSDRQGRFLLFGGSEDGPYGEEGGSAEVQAFSVGNPDEALGFEVVGTMPPLDEDESDLSGRVGHSATLLTGQHQDNGKILVVGGALDFQVGEHSSNSVFLWDPESDEAESLGRSGELSKPSFHHSATQDALGNVVIAGGLGEAPVGSILNHMWSWQYDPLSQEMHVVSGMPSSALVWHAAAAIKTSGVILCGGLSTLAGSGDNYYISDDCDLVDTNGAMASSVDMPVPLMHHTMTTLEDGRVLAVGGFTASGSVADGAVVPSNAKGYLFDGNTWEATTGSLNIPRGEHSAALLPDGRVLIVGGATETESHFWNATAAIACAEIFDPATENFTLVDACSETSDVASLPERSAFPMIAADSDHGALVVGGISDDFERPAEGVSLFVPAP